jgi:hypothetical protein
MNSYVVKITTPNPEGLCSSRVDTSMPTRRSTTPSPSALIFQVPELAHIVFGYLEIGDIAGLMSVSKAFFSLAVPLRWEHTTCATSLFRLLPCDETEAGVPSYKTARVFVRQSLFLVIHDRSLSFQYRRSLAHSPNPTFIVSMSMHPTSNTYIPSKTKNS